MPRWMHKQIMLYSSNTTQKEKRNELLNTYNHTNESQKHCAKQKELDTRVYIVWSHLYDILEQVKLIRSEIKHSDSCLHKEGGWGGVSAKGYQQIFWRVMEMFYIWIKMVVAWLYTFVKIHQTVSRLKISAFYYMQIICQ